MTYIGLTDLDTRWRRAAGRLLVTAAPRVTPANAYDLVIDVESIRAASLEMEQVPRMTWGIWDFGTVLYLEGEGVPRVTGTAMENMRWWEWNGREWRPRDKEE